jgi:hypothetical protein
MITKAAALISSHVTHPRLTPSLGFAAEDAPGSSDALLGKGLRRLPRSASLRRAHAWEAYARGDWTEAARRWAAYRATDPADKVGSKRGGEALQEDN